MLLSHNEYKRAIKIIYNLKILSRASCLIGNSNIRSVILETKMADVKWSKC